ncbi:hypothetical protein LR48_Vigan09g001600 [Vigna angularis]|uniref:Uncharacterized protein n=1 Tax=Phaseolus angularis TaxID=3914 RepID=A0A0L9V8X8_PHAAN|nr:hypothetical protein LR48_Vigan09g001600 [Vigna angularis]
MMSSSKSFSRNDMHTSMSSRNFNKSILAWRIENHLLDLSPTLEKKTRATLKRSRAYQHNEFAVELIINLLNIRASQLEIEWERLVDALVTPSETDLPNIGLKENRVEVTGARILKGVVINIKKYDEMIDLTTHPKTYLIQSSICRLRGDYFVNSPKIHKVGGKRDPPTFHKEVHHENDNNPSPYSISDHALTNLWTLKKCVPTKRIGHNTEDYHEELIRSKALASIKGTTEDKAATRVAVEVKDKEVLQDKVEDNQSNPT